MRVTLLGRLLPLRERGGGDLSVELLPEWSRDEDTGYFFGFGTGGNAFSQLARQGRRVALLEGPRACAVPGKLHRIQIEREGPLLRLAVDGEPLLEHRELVPLDMGAGARVVLYTWDACARFQEVTVERRSGAKRPHRSEVADGLFEKGEPRAAALLYAAAANEPGVGVAERSELELKRALAEIEAAALADRPEARARLEGAVAILEPLARGTPLTELVLRAEVGLAEAELVGGSIEVGLARARRVAALPLRGARDTVLELLAREDARLLAHARHEERLRVLKETRDLSPGPRVDFETSAATAESLVELGRVRAAASLLSEAIARQTEPGARFELLVELAAARSRGGERDLAREAVAACRSASRGQGDDLAMRALVEEATLELDAGDRAVEETLAAARAVAARVPSHLPVIAALEAEAGLEEASANRAALLAALDAATLAGAAKGATDTARLFGARAALAAAASRVVARDEEAARDALGSAVSSRGTLSTSAVSALLVDALLEERAGRHEAARRALERAAASRTPHLAAAARALAQGPVGAEEAARLLDASGECRRDRAVLALALGGSLLARGDSSGALLLEQAVAPGAPAPVRAIARAFR